MVINALLMFDALSVTMFDALSVTCTQFCSLSETRP